MDKKLDWMMENSSKIMSVFSLIEKTHEFIGSDIFDAKVIEHSGLMGKAYIELLKTQKDMLATVDFKEFYLKLEELLDL